MTNHIFLTSTRLASSLLSLIQHWTKSTVASNVTTEYIDLPTLCMHRDTQSLLRFPFFLRRPFKNSNWSEPWGRCSTRREVGANKHLEAARCVWYTEFREMEGGKYMERWLGRWGCVGWRTLKGMFSVRRRGIPNAAWYAFKWKLFRVERGSVQWGFCWRLTSDFWSLICVLSMDERWGFVWRIALTSVKGTLDILNSKVGKCLFFIFRIKLRTSQYCKSLKAMLHVLVGRPIR